MYSKRIFILLFSMGLVYSFVVIYFICAGKEESFHHKQLVNHLSLLDDDVSSDSGLETETPISRKKVIHGSSVKHTGMYAAMYYTEKYNSSTLFVKMQSTCI